MAPARRPSEPIARVIGHDERLSDRVRPLSGARLGVKELIAVRGVERTANSHVPLPSQFRRTDVESPVLVALRAAGAVVRCVTTSHEFAWGITGREGRRVVDNPIMPGHVPGGSSSGSAAVVATRAVDLALGTDTAGSARIPAAWCGVYGWKPTHGRWTTEHTLPLAPDFDCIGLLSSSVDQLNVALSVLDVHATAEVDSVAVARLGAAVVDPRAEAAVTEAAESFAHRDVPVRYIDLPPLDVIYRAFTVLQLRSALRVHRDVFATWPAEADSYGLGVRLRLELAERLSSEEIRRARRLAGELTATLRDITSSTPVLLPATGCAPPANDAPDVAIVGGRKHPVRDVVIPFTAPASLAGLPAAVVPWAVGAAPFGVQLIGGHGRDEVLKCAVSMLAPLATGSRPRR